MSARLLADVWRELLDHCDTENVIREIFGDFDIYQAPSSFQDIYKPSRQLLLRLRIIFDLQRTYLQSRASQPRAPKIASYIISPDLHHAIILRIVQLGTTTQFQHGIDPVENSFHQLLIVQTLFSAFRAFMLQQGQLTDIQLNELQLRVESLVHAWENRMQQALPEAEDFILRTVLPQTLEQLRHPQVSATIKNVACGNFDLPEYPALHPFHIQYAPNREEPSHFALRSTIQELDSRNWIPAYWTLCDVVWSVKAASIKSSMESQGAPGLPGSEEAMNEVISTLFERTDLPVHLSKRSPAMKSLSDAMLTSYGAATISALEIEEQLPNLSFGQPPGWLKAKVDEDLEAFRAFLSRRNNQLHATYRDYKPPLPACPVPKPEFIENTKSAPELVLLPSENKDPIPEDTLHPLPLRHPLRSTGVTFSHTPQVEKIPSRLLSNASSISSNPSNPRSPVYSDRSSDYEPLGGNTARVTNPTSPARTSITHDSSTIESKKSRRLSFRPSLSKWGRSSSEVKTPLPDTLTFAFDSSGKSLLVWLKKDCEFLVKIDAPFHEANRFSLLSGKGGRIAGAVVKHVAASKQKFAVLAQYHGEGQKLFLFDELRKRHEAESNTFLGNKGVASTSLAISPDGAMVALGWGTTIQIYRFTMDGLSLFTAVPIHESHSGAVVRYQSLNFSLDSSKLIAATQEIMDTHKHTVYLRVWDCKDEVKIQWRPQGFHVTVGYGDDTGVTTVFYDNASVKAFLAANISKAYSSVISMNGSRTSLDTLPAKNIDTAAQSPTGIHFAFKNGKSNKIYTLDLRSGEATLLTDLDSERKSVKEEAMALAMPEQDVILAVWRKGAKIMMKRIRVGGRVPEIQTEDLRAVYDRVSSDV